MNNQPYEVYCVFNNKLGNMQMVEFIKNMGGFQDRFLQTRTCDQSFV